MTTTLIIIGSALFTAMMYFMYCRKRNRDYFLKKLHEQQICRLAKNEDDEAIVRIVALFTDSAVVVDQKTLEESKVPITNLYPL